MGAVLSLGKTLYPLLSTSSMQATSQHDRKFFDWDIKHQIESACLCVPLPHNCDNHDCLL